MRRRERYEYGETVNADAPSAPETKRAGGADAGEWRERTKWVPSQNEMQAYLEREVEMAKMNLKRGLLGEQTLHSSRTVSLAQEALKEEKP